jgi:hypothetical protein
LTTHRKMPGASAISFGYRVRSGTDVLAVTAIKANADKRAAGLKVTFDELRPEGITSATLLFRYWSGILTTPPKDDATLPTWSILAS